MKPLKIIYYLFITCLAVVAFLLIFLVFPIPGNYKLMVVQSGSMEPALKMGSLAIVAPSDSYLSNDIISFSPDNDKKNIVTHRIAVKLYPEGIDNKPVFLTAGDANHKFDREKIKEEQIMGKMIFSVPYLGYAANFVKQPYGFILFVVVPITIIVYEELRSVKKEIKDVYSKFKKSSAEKKSGKGSVGRMAVIVSVLAAVLALTSLSISFFSDNEKATANSFVAGEWVPTSTPTETPTPTPTPTPPIVENVVINELMWMGSHESTFDEWIELYNTTASPIDLTGWTITNAGSGSDSITLSGSIPASGYFLISHYASTTSSIKDLITVDQVVAGIGLNNDGEQLVLKNSGGTTIDQTPSGAWSAGVNGTDSDPDRSMERNDDPATGWHTCTNDTCNDTIYWDTEGNNYGTPKAANL